MHRQCCIVVPESEKEENKTIRRAINEVVVVTRSKTEAEVKERPAIKKKMTTGEEVKISQEVKTPNAMIVSSRAERPQAENKTIRRAINEVVVVARSETEAPYQLPKELALQSVARPNRSC